MKKNFIKQIVLFFITFLLFYGPRLNFLDLHLLTSTILALYGLALFFVKQSKDLIIPAVWGVVFLLYNLLVLMLAGGKDFTMVGLAFKWLIYLFAVSAIFYIYKKTLHFTIIALDVLCFHVILSSALNALVVCFVMFSSSFRGLLFSLLSYTTQETWVESGHRSFDLSMGGGAIASIVFALALMLCAILLKTQTKIFRNLVFMLLLLVATLLTGRSGQVVIILGLFYLIIYRIFWSINFPERRLASSSFYVKYFTSSALIVATIVAVLFMMNAEVVLNYLYKFIPWVSETLNLFVAGGQVASVEKISNEMLFLPSSLLQIVFGDSNAGRHPNLEYIASDVGYVRTIFASGVLGTMIYVSFFMYCALLAVRDKTRYGAFLFFMMVVLLIFNFKELLLFHKALGVWLFFSLFLVTETEKLRRRIC